MELKGLQVKDIIKIPSTIYLCPYCGKKLLSKNSYRNHLIQGYCLNYDHEYELKKQQYNNCEITTNEFFQWVIDNGYDDVLYISDKEKEQLSEELRNKLQNNYFNGDDYYE